VRALGVAGFLVPLVALGCGAAQQVELALDTSQRYQKMEGLGATVPWTPIWTRKKPLFPPKGFIAPRHAKLTGHQQPVPPALLSKLLDDAVFDLGLSRLRLEVGPYMEKGNDNADPRLTDPNGFYFSWLDCCVEEIVLPVKQRIERRGDRLVLTVSYAIENWETPKWLQQPEEYAEFARTVLLHLRDKYGLVPDYWVLGNESRMGHSAMVLLGQWLRENGFATRFAFPEGVNLKVSLQYVDELKRKFPQAAAYIGQVTYHTYGAGGNAERHALRDWARELGVSTAMTEKIGAGVDQLYLDLTEANISGWQRYSLVGFSDKPLKGTYFYITPDRRSYHPSLGYWELRQYFRYVRQGAVRVSVTSTSDALKPVAFVLPRGKVVVVVLNKGGAQQVQLANLPAGTYAVSYARAQGPAQELAPLRVARGQRAAVSVPARCVLTLTGDPPRY